MFFIGVFGIDSKEKEIKKIYSVYCKNCGENKEGKLIKTFSYLHFFFIPLFKWNEMYFFICDKCRSVYEVNKDKGKRIERGEDIQLTYWDLKEYNIIYEYEEKGAFRVCGNCGRTIDKSFVFCPYCGKDIKR